VGLEGAIMKKLITMIFLISTFMAYGNPLFSCFDPIKDKHLIQKLKAKHLDDYFIMKLKYFDSNFNRRFNDCTDWVLRLKYKQIQNKYSTREKYILDEHHDIDHKIKERFVTEEEKSFFINDISFERSACNDNQLEKDKVNMNSNSWKLSMKELISMFSKTNLKRIYGELTLYDDDIFLDDNLGAKFINLDSEIICPQLKSYLSAGSKASRNTYEFEWKVLEPLNGYNFLDKRKASEADAPPRVNFERASAKVGTFFISKDSELLVEKSQNYFQYEALDEILQHLLSDEL
jgi:hypothetical protein